MYHLQYECNYIIDLGTYDFPKNWKETGSYVRKKKTTYLAIKFLHFVWNLPLLNLLEYLLALYNISFIKILINYPVFIINMT